ncbi:hypothetical protein PENSPDRAFT_658523 [Peniophora sp. CONT]|nr:hypothetical protein PENSPDRAFT_658523 [Peniophora sp. CONT]
MPTSLPASPVEKHPEHFYPNGDIKFLVNRTLYQLHPDILARQSGWFRRYLAAKDAGDSDGTLPAGWRAEPGPFCTVYVHFGKEKIQFERPSAYNVDEQTGAIVMEDITVQDMDAFLAVLYPTNFVTFGLATHEYADVLKVAHMWDCPGISALAIERLDQAWSDHSYSFQRLMLARKYDVKDWIDDALNDLIQDPDPLSLDEIAQMLPEDILRVTNAREEYARREGHPQVPCVPVEMTTMPPIPHRAGTQRSEFVTPTTRPASPPTPPADPPCPEPCLPEAEPFPPTPSSRDSPTIPTRVASCAFPPQPESPPPPSSELEVPSQPDDASVQPTIRVAPPDPAPVLAQEPEPEPVPESAPIPSRRRALTMMERRQRQREREREKAKRARAAAAAAAPLLQILPLGE